MSITIVRAAISLLVILSMLERAHAALVSDDIVLGRQFVDGALRRLERAKADQDEVLGGSMVITAGACSWPGEPPNFALGNTPRAQPGFAGSTGTAEGHARRLNWACGR